MPSAGTGTQAEDQHRRQRHQQHHPGADRQRRHQHVAGAADRAGQPVHQPDQGHAGEHDIRIEERRRERLAVAAKRAIQRRAEDQRGHRESGADREVDDQRVQHQAIGIVAPAAAEGTGDRRRDAATHRAGRQHLHHHQHRKHQRHAGQRVDPEPRHPPGLDQPGGGLRQHHRDIGQGEPQQSAGNRRFQQAPGA